MGQAGVSGPSWSSGEGVSPVLTLGTGGEGRATPIGLLAGEGVTDTGLTPPPWLRFRHEEAAARDASLGGVTFARWGGPHAPTSDTNPTPSLSFASQGPMGGKAEAC